MEVILSVIAGFIIDVIKLLGYPGIILLMAFESANIPLPSEVIMPFSGFLVAGGRFDLWLVSLAGAIGCVVGSVFSYWLGYFGGRPFMERYGRYIFISKHDLAKADQWFIKYGEWAIFISRLLPVVRTFISFPAGMTKMHFKRFVLYTFAGSFLWCLGLAYVGFRMGENWERLRETFRGFDVAIGVFIIVVIIWYIWRHIKHNLKSKVQNPK